MPVETIGRNDLYKILNQLEQVDVPPVQQLPKILIYDIETLPNLGYFFDTFSDRGIPLDFVVREKSICTIAYKWLGDDEATVLEMSAPYDDKSLLEEFSDIYVQADYAVAHYGTGFDEKFIAARMMANGLGSLPPVTQIDTYKLAKKHFGRSLNSNKLDHLGSILGDGVKKPRPCHWINESIEMHAHKSARHSISALEELAERQPPGDEDHFKNAFVRSWMALCAREQRK